MDVKERTAPSVSPTPTALGARMLCRARHGLVRAFPPELQQNRLRAITSVLDKWVNGTVLHYFFFDKPTDGSTVTLPDGTTQFVPWKGDAAQKAAVRRGFAHWKEIGLGLEFREVACVEDAEVRIGFMRNDGSWSWVGRQILDIAKTDRTMNFGWNIADDADTVLHEIGHTLGMYHEHQNPFAGIVWNEAAVYDALAAPPNNWTRETTFENILRKLTTKDVDGTSWDPDSVMQYPFEPGLIAQPKEYSVNGLRPAGGLSPHDIAWMKRLYPQQGPTADLPQLKVLESRALCLDPGQQIDLLIKPDETREYDIKTFGASDALMVLFEEEAGELRYRCGDDDSAENRNVQLKPRLQRGRTYVLRLRLFYAARPRDLCVLWW